MLSNEIIEACFSLFVQIQQDKHQRYHSAAKMVVNNYLKYLHNVKKNKESEKQIVLIGQMSLFKDDSNFPKEYLAKIIDDINTEGKQHQTLLEEDDDLVERLISISQTTSLKQAPVLPISMKAGKSFTESQSIKSGELVFQITALEVDVFDEDEVTYILRLARESLIPQEFVSIVLQKAAFAVQWNVVKRILELTEQNKANQESVSVVLFCAAVALQWDIARLILESNEEYKPSQESVRAALALALSVDEPQAAQWDVVKLILGLAGENKVTQKDVGAALTLATRDGQQDIVMLILGLTGENKPNQQKTSIILSSAMYVGQLDIAKLILKLTGENKPNQKAVSDSLIIAVAFNNGDIVKLILELKGENKTNQENKDSALSSAVTLRKWDIAVQIIELSEEYEASVETITYILELSSRTFQWDIEKNPLLVPMLIHQKAALTNTLETARRENNLVLCKFIEDGFKYLETYQKLGTQLEEVKSLLNDYIKENSSIGFFSEHTDQQPVAAVQQIIQSIGKDIKDINTLLEKLREITSDNPSSSLARCIQSIETQYSNQKIDHGAAIIDNFSSLPFPQ